MNSFLRIQSRHRAALVSSLILALAPGAIAQTLYVPSGTVGNSGNGNVGIGTSAPGFKLDVNGDVNSGGGSWMGLYARANGAIATLRISDPTSYGTTIGFVGTDTNTPFVIRSNAQPVAWFTTNGNVGIATGVPRQKLEVFATSNPSINIHDGGTAELTLGVREAVPIALFNTNSTGFDFRTGQDGVTFPGTGTSRLTILSSGNVGIGTASPAGRIEVNFPASAGSTALILRTSDSVGNGTIRWQSSSSANQAGIGSNFNVGDPGALEFLNGTSTSMIVRSSGNVGIGTTNPTQKLSVNGTVRAKEVIVEASPWPDDVFAPGYALPALGEVEAHIAAHGHLPGVPNAATVAEQGVAVGEMQKTLLRKIEELTLHQIRQERILTEQAATIAAQQEQIRSLRAALTGSVETSTAASP